MTQNSEIKLLEDEIQKLKGRLEEKTNHYLKLWERDFHIGILIEDALEKPDMKQAMTLLNKIKEMLAVPDDFEKPTVNQAEMDQLTEQLQQFEIKNLDNERKVRELESIKEATDKNVENLNQTIAKLELICKRSENEMTDLKTHYEKKLIDLVLKNDKVTEEKEFRKYQLKKLEEQMNAMSKQEGNKENQQNDDYVHSLEMKLAKMEGMLHNKAKELKVVWEKMEFYRNRMN